jgi:hypothetical protein
MTSFKNTLETTQTDDVESPVKTYRRIKPAMSPDSPTSPEHRPVKIKAESSADSPEASCMPSGSPPAAPEKGRKRKGGKKRKVEVGADAVDVAAQLPSGADMAGAGADMADMPVVVATRLSSRAVVDADMPVLVVSSLLTSARVPADEIQIAPPDSRPLSPIQEEGAGGAQVIDSGVSRTVIPAVVAVAVPVQVKGVCEVCGSDVLNTQPRNSDGSGYVHRSCIKTMGLCRNAACGKAVLNVQKGHMETDEGYVHAACGTFKANCQKCGKVVLSNSKGRIGENGLYWHAGCNTAAKHHGKCPACKQWVYQNEVSVRIATAGKAASYFHTACAPPP